MSGPTYTYTQNTPNAADAQNQTTSLIQNNFLAIQELLQVNHASWSDPYASTNLGMHNFVTLPFNPPTDAPVPATTDINVFSAATGSPNAAEIFYQLNDGTLGQITDVQTGGSGGTPAGTSGTGWSQFSTSGLIIKWGTGTVTTTAYGNILFNFRQELVFLHIRIQLDM